MGQREEGRPGSKRREQPSRAAWVCAARVSLTVFGAQLPQKAGNPLPLYTRFVAVAFAASLLRT